MGGFEARVVESDTRWGTVECPKVVEWEGRWKIQRPETRGGKYTTNLGAEGKSPISSLFSKGNTNGHKFNEDFCGSPLLILFPCQKSRLTNTS